MIKQTMSAQNLKPQDFVKFAGGWYQVKIIMPFAAGTMIEVTFTRIDTKMPVEIEVTMLSSTIVTFKRPRF